MIKFVPIMLEVEDGMPLSTLQAINRLPGVAKIHLNLDAGVPPKANGKSFPLNDGSKKPSMREVLLAILAHRDPEPVSSAELADAVERSGYARSSLSNYLVKLENEGAAARVTNRRGYWKLTERARHGLEAQNMPAAPATRALPAPATKKTTRAPGGKTMVELIVERLAESSDPTSRKDIKKLLEGHGFSANGVDGALHQLRGEKRIKSTTPGFYELTALGKKQHSPTGA